MEDQIQSQAIVSDESAELSFWGKFINIFTNPRITFEALDKRPTWLVPMLILLVLTLLSSMLNFSVMMESYIENFRNNPNISPEQMQVIEQQFAENMSTQKYLTMGGQVVGFPIVYLIMAGIFYFTGSVILGGDSTFKKVLSVYSWSGCIAILGSIIVTLLIYTKGTMNVTLSPALLLSGDSLGTTLYTLLSKFDLFTIWFLAVFAAGFAIVFRFSTTKAYVAVGVLWGIWIAVSTAFANVFKNFGM